MDVRQNDEIYKLTDGLDMELVEKEMRGETVKEFVYEVEVEGEKIYIPSVVGLRVLAQTLCQQNQPVRVVECQVMVTEMDGEEYVAALARAENHLGFSWFGAAVQPVRKEGQFDPFAFPKAVSRAQRNALRGVISPSILTEFIQYCLSHDRFRTVSVPSSLPEQHPKELPVEQSPYENTIPSEDVQEAPDRDETELWRAIYRKARRRWGDDFRTELDNILLTLYGKKRNLTVSQLQKVLEVIDDL